MIIDFLRSISPRYTQANYNLLHHNCNHFTNELSEFLIGKGIPDSVLNQHKVILNSPMGKSVEPLLMMMENVVEGVNTNHFQQGGGPYGAR